jgi:hypothetical protein
VSTHYSEDDLTLYYYGEGRRRAAIERHLQDCAACATLHREIAGTLAMIVADDVPERGDQYGLEIWQRIRHQLPEQEARFTWFARFIGFGFEGFGPFGRLAAVGGAVAVLMLVAFIAGRSSSPSNPVIAGNTTNPGNGAKPGNPNNGGSTPNLVNAEASRQRILLTSVADHLDRSERMLTDIMNANDVPHGSDISVEQGWAEDLLTTSRLYRQDAMDAGEQSVANVLDDLERNLLEIVHSPAKISAADLEQLRKRIDAAALLFKVRVMSEALRERESAPADRPTPRGSTSKIS